MSVGSATKQLILVVAVLAIVLAASYWYANGILPQAMSCVPENTPEGSGPNYKPTLIVQVESGGRKNGHIDELHVLGCNLYFYNSG